MPNHGATRERQPNRGWAWTLPNGLGVRAEVRVREFLTEAGFDVPAGLGHHAVAQLSTLSWQAD
ncbi:hypothetical protein Ato02nite_096600 [Paractinoplanes toevensis]|uniref:Uncharacterized protein n=1 Tax=Paractinoplanes toevensis TaxID=571911 RepID=A0A919WCR9_9ACTN|nr:hypothetical protein Ato02nite_096600 [Actinoplanes toevensis]